MEHNVRILNCSRDFTYLFSQSSPLNIKGNSIDMSLFIDTVLGPGDLGLFFLFLIENSVHRVSPLWCRKWEHWMVTEQNFPFGSHNEISVNTLILYAFTLLHLDNAMFYNLSIWCHPEEDRFLLSRNENWMLHDQCFKQYFKCLTSQLYPHHLGNSFSEVCVVFS